jgi:hypothetical protein
MMPYRCAVSPAWVDKEGVCAVSPQYDGLASEIQLMKPRRPGWNIFCSFSKVDREQAKNHRGDRELVGKGPTVMFLGTLNEGRGVRFGA